MEVSTMFTISYFIITPIVIWFLVYRKPRNTKWQRCMRCKDCDVFYPSGGMNMSVYECPECGYDTTYAMYKYTDGKPEVRDKK